MTPHAPSEYSVSPNPVVLTAVQGTSGVKSFVSIYDNGELLPGGVIAGNNVVDTVGLYQNGVEIGSKAGYLGQIVYNGKRVIHIGTVQSTSGYTFYMQLRNGIDYQHGTILPNGDYDLVVVYKPNSKNYTVPITVAVP